MRIIKKICAAFVVMSTLLASTSVSAYAALPVEKLVENYDLNIKVAVMGCVVNGPGEAKEADIGIAGGIGEGLLIKKGRVVKKLPEDELLPALKEELDMLSKEA